MITMTVSYDIVCQEYKKESDELISILRNSNSKYKDTDINDIKWIYTFSYFLKKGEGTQEYYENLYKMPFEDRFKEELKKVRVSIGYSAKYFYLSDRVDGISDTIKEALRIVTIQKMVNEQSLINDEDVIKTIPGIETPEILPEPMTLEEQLKQAIDMEDYMEAARIRDEIKKSQEV